MQLYQIYETYQSDLLRYASSLCRHKEDAEDLVQQTYVKALDQYELFDHMHPMQIKGWLLSTIRTTFIDQFRRERRKGVFDEAMEVPYEANIEDRLITSDLLGQLPESLRIVVVLRYLEGYSSVQIGELLSLNPSTVRSRLSQAIGLLRKVVSYK
ncbi:RNA polymerase sigma factor [Fusibacter bizertensis]